MKPVGQGRCKGLVLPIYDTLPIYNTPPIYDMRPSRIYDTGAPAPNYISVFTKSYS